jgi:hypothetical protein
MWMYYMYESLGVLLPFILIMVVVAQFIAISTLIGIARDKGHWQDGAGLAWIIGLFGHVITLGLIVCALPDRKSEATNTAGTQEQIASTSTSGDVKLPADASGND